MRHVIRTYASTLCLALAGQFGLGFAVAAQRGEVTGFLREAMTLCIQNDRDPNVLVQELDARGYSYTPERMDEETVIHWFAAPQPDLGTVMITYENFSLHCAIGTDMIGVTEAIPLAGTILEEAFPGLFVAGSHENGPVITPGNAAGDSCTGYAAFLPQSATEVTIGMRGQDPVCVENGTAQVMIWF
ncbi:hypothetical protein OB2597_09609 [Pseudooceanicola batsensis HTCC2597]|uniref:Uncharacterized protein n=1 Tax=Pseudooceanicola batsensis (strain ATCC BAA-863 / DSM 15984 / KCTC 12145 / HTCC2597) TaxID=252305 RepID=A3TV44_PSEBH|nr:hypothetical protein [Pseudooceanicola batsensis]EAQ04390.1 hypothetical protein OB2597_09609 [Pseudooceanicola batsensis HTCC2597]